MNCGKKLNATGAFSNEQLILLEMLSVVLIEIRASKNLRTCQALADAFHNVPQRLAIEFDAEETLEDIFTKAERSGILSYCKSLYESSKEKTRRST